MRSRLLAAAAASVVLASPARTAEPPAPTASQIAALGKLIFFDQSLSASGRLSCASCHDPAHAYGPPDGKAVQLGGQQMDRQGSRAVPSLRYVLNRTPIWSKEFIANEAERTLEGDEPPSGGFGWDGRFNSLRDQAAFPLLSPDEMANADVAEVASRLARSQYSKRFRELFGERIFDDPQLAYARALGALERFELDDPSLRPYSSRFDAYLNGTVELTSSERRGMKLFDDPASGNCASCHRDTNGADGSHPLFTDYEFEALGVPRNAEIRANGSGSYFDLGLCGPMRLDQLQQHQYCGMFKTPTLRNVAIRKVFFHNGRFHDLRDALRFYVRRDSDPALWYPSTYAGKVNKFDDLPTPLRLNVDVHDEPLTRAQGGTPAWSDADIEDVVAFLRTLTDSDAQAAGN